MHSSAYQGLDPVKNVKCSPFQLISWRVGGTCYVFPLPVKEQQPYRPAHQGEDRVGSIHCKVRGTPVR